MGDFWPESLVREFADRRAILFTGAGVSMAAGSQGGITFPSWAALLSDLSKKLPKIVERDLVKKLVYRNQYLDAAQILWEGIPSADVRAYIKSTLSTNTTSPSDIFKYFAKIDPSVILTTNYDRLAEEAFVKMSTDGSPYNICIYNQSHALDDIRSPQHAYLKVHGCVGQPAEIVLTRKQYFDARKDYPSFFNVVSALVVTSTVLFVGYSLSDPDIQLILEGNNLAAPSKNPHYALVPKMEHSSLRKALQDTYNIHFIEYPKGNHSEMLVRISELSELVTALRTSRRIP
jgi:hypothetical protein